MKKFLKVAGTVAVIGTAAFAGGSSLSAPNFDLSNVVTVAGALLTGLAGLWAIKKALHLIR